MGPPPVEYQKQERACKNQARPPKRGRGIRTCCALFPGKWIPPTSHKESLLFCTKNPPSAIHRSADGPRAESAKRAFGVLWPSGSETLSLKALREAVFGCFEGNSARSTLRALVVGYPVVQWASKLACPGEVQQWEGSICRLWAWG